MKANHARMISSALLLLAGATLANVDNPDYAKLALGMMIAGGLALLVEWIYSFPKPPPPNIT